MSVSMAGAGDVGHHLWFLSEAMQSPSILAVGPCWLTSVVGREVQHCRALVLQNPPAHSEEQGDTC